MNEHVDYPHEKGFLHDCSACHERCHCTATSAECVYEGIHLVWVPTDSVITGDRIACLLSDARTYPRVTGWTDHVLDLTSHDLGVIVRREFAIAAAPWWCDRDMRSFTLSDSRYGSACETLIVRRKES